MSNRPRVRRQHTNQRKRIRAAAITAARASGCTCDPDVRHDATGRMTVSHDHWCAMADHGQQVVIVHPSWRPPHREDPTR